MEGGIGPGHTSQITDFMYRDELYDDWTSIISRTPNYEMAEFCKGKGIKLAEFLKIIAENESYNKKGSS